ncbi:hypothetical protein [Robertmurraya andreesenii]|uniref:Phage protein n=1 Tax=Anoxybacillus andreesenii TaxID=1325932 RepID=A0ABT9V261_9BACL|nr:hypothetical protein [Robertmurraya andreesenii]MDQ0154982.1 hypothetical protein [Robertmurraya andreesenii]
MNLLAKHFAGDEKGLMSALVNGYEIEKTPEDAVKEYFKKCEELRLKSTGTEYQIYLAKSTTIKTTLTFLGIKIEGVNA